MLSFLLHGTVVLLIFFMPAPAPLRLNMDLPILNLSRVSIGSSAPAAEESLPPSPKPEPTPEPAPIPEPIPEPAPEQIPEPTPEPTPEPAPIPEPIPEPVPEPAPAPILEPVPIPGPLPEPIPEPAPEPTPEPAPEAPSEEDILKAAFAEASRTAKPPPRVSGGRSMLEQALSEARAEAGKGGDVVSGERGDGVGYYGTYRDSVISRVREHFITRPRSDGKIFEMTVVMEIADDGSVTKVNVVKPSGDGTFDLNVLRAIREAGKMEPPLRAEVKNLEIVFNSQLIGGR
ncbi:MAG: TonB C-terminal domain-containing protein [Deltaproteobacteria bacterium]|nr:TonB C-terminal domain-containing protein [Deltaproteobacteria bacterium]